MHMALTFHSLTVRPEEVAVVEPNMDLVEQVVLQLKLFPLMRQRNMEMLVETLQRDQVMLQVAAEVVQVLPVLQ
jgi:hypothetical protein